MTSIATPLLRLSHYSLLAMLGLALSACQPTKQPHTEPDLVSLLNQNLTNTVVLDAFKPPVAARIYAYSNLAIFECLRMGDSTMPSMSAYVENLDSLPTPAVDQIYNWEIAAIACFSKVAQETVYRDYMIEQYTDSLLELYKKSTSAKTVEPSIAFGEEMAKRVIAMSKKDKYGYTRTLAKYTPLYAEDKWQPTLPKYGEACEPNWGKTVCFFIDSPSQFRPGAPLAYADDKNSPFYKINLEVYEKSKTVSEEQKEIALFWDDNPAPLAIDGHLMKTYKQISPGGHWVSIACQVFRQEKTKPVLQAKILTVLTMTISDAFKSIWHTKYFYETIRPVTYINRLIDPNWLPFIETPPFPEYSSGHAGISIAGSIIMTHYFGDNHQFTDSSEIPYGKGIRSFESFDLAAKEAAISRVYAGIHYAHACDSGRVEGANVANYALRKLNVQ